MTIPRICADFNGLVPGLVNPEREAVVMDTAGTIRDLANAGIILEEGMPLIAWDGSDEVEDLARPSHQAARFSPGLVAHGCVEARRRPARVDFSPLLALSNDASTKTRPASRDSLCRHSGYRAAVEPRSVSRTSW